MDQHFIHAIVAQVIAREQRISPTDLVALERLLDSLFHQLGIDIEFTRHFLDRVNDPRNQRQITFRELQELFLATYRQYARKLRQYGDHFQAVLVDLSSQINIPFALEWNPDTKMLELRNKTIMRKPHFRTPNKKLIVRT